MDVLSLFSRDCEKLAALSEERDDYEVLGAALILRRLLIDGDRLIDRVNRRFKLRVSFQVCELPTLPAEIPAPTIVSLPDGINPEQAPPGFPRKTVNASQLLKHVVLSARGHDFTVHDIVSFLANFGGAVHHKDPADERRRLLKKLNETFFIADLPKVVNHLRGISQVVLKGLEPLRAEVLWARLDAQRQAVARPAELEPLARLFRKSVTARDWTRARRSYEALLGMARSTQGAAVSWFDLVFIACQLGRWLSKQQLLEELRWVYRGLRDAADEVTNDSAMRVRGLGVVVGPLAEQSARAGLVAEAETHLQEMIDMQAVDPSWEWGWRIASLRASLAAAYNSLGNKKASAEALSCLQAMREEYLDDSRVLEIAEWADDVARNNDRILEQPRASAREPGPRIDLHRP